MGNDFQEWIGSHIYANEEEEIKNEKTILKRLIKGWFDDRLECRKALYQLPQLNALIPGLDRSVLPWMWPGVHRRHPLEEWDYDEAGITSIIKNTANKSNSSGLDEILSQ